MTSKQYDAIIIGGEVSGAKAACSYMEALRALEQVGFNRLPRTEAGLYFDGQVIKK
jgi:hypothetical protein